MKTIGRISFLALMFIALLAGITIIAGLIHLVAEGEGIAALAPYTDDAVSLLTSPAAIVATIGTVLGRA